MTWMNRKWILKRYLPEQKVAAETNKLKAGSRPNTGCTFHSVIRWPFSHVATIWMLVPSTAFSISSNRSPHLLHLIYRNNISSILSNTTNFRIFIWLIEEGLGTKSSCPDQVSHSLSSSKDGPKSTSLLPSLLVVVVEIPEVSIIGEKFGSLTDNFEGLSFKDVDIIDF